MSRSTKALMFFLLGVLALAAMGFIGHIGYQRYLEQQERAKNSAAKVETALRVSCQPVVSGDVRELRLLTGTVRAMAEVEVAPKISGRLERLRLEDGTPVDRGLVIKEAGTLIAVIDHKDLDAELAQAEAAVTVATAVAAEAQAVLKDAEREKARQVELFEKSGTTEQARDRAVSTYERALALKMVADAGVIKARAALDWARVVLSEAFIKAPIAGVVADKHRDEGNMVNPNTPIVRIVDMDTVKIVVGVSENDVGKLEAGKTKVRASVSSDTRQEIDAVVSKIGVTSDPVMHTVDVELHVPNPGHALLPGSFARVSLGLGERKNVPLVPERAVVQRSGETYVFVAKEGRAHQRSVRLGVPEGDHFEVLSGVSVGELIVTSGQGQLREGDPVEIETSKAGKEGEL